MVAMVKERRIPRFLIFRYLIVNSLRMSKRAMTYEKVMTAQLLKKRSNKKASPSLI